MLRAVVTGAAAFVVTLALAVAAVLPVGPSADAQAAPEVADVFVLGDSVLLGAADRIVAAMPQHRVAVDAEVSRTAYSAPALLEGRTHDVAIVHLGHNDGPGGFSSRIDDTMRALAGVEDVIWLTQQEFRADRGEMNRALRAAADRWPSLEVLDWHAIASRTPDANWADGLHLRPEGADAMARAIALAVEFSLAVTPMELFATAGAWSAAGLAEVERRG